MTNQSLTIQISKERERELLSYLYQNKERDLERHQTIFSHSYFSFQRERERVRERKRERNTLRPSGEHRSSRAPICDLQSTTICDDALATSDDEGRTSDESTTSRQGRRATEQAAPASDVTVGVSPWVQFALGLGFGFLCIGFFFFLVDKQICIAILGNGVWFAFALYGLYLVFSTNDVTMD